MSIDTTKESLGSTPVATSTLDGEQRQFIFLDSKVMGMETYTSLNFRGGKLESVTFSFMQVREMDRGGFAQFVESLIHKLDDICGRCVESEGELRHDWMFTAKWQSGEDLAELDASLSEDEPNNSSIYTAVLTMSHSATVRLPRGLLF